MVQERLGRDLPPGESIARIWIERLPDTAAAAVDLIGELAR